MRVAGAAGEVVATCNLLKATGEGPPTRAVRDRVAPSRPRDVPGELSYRAAAEPGAELRGAVLVAADGGRRSAGADEPQARARGDAAHRRGSQLSSWFGGRGRNVGGSLLPRRRLL